MSYDIPLIPPTVPEGFCNQLTGSDWVQILANEIVGRGVAQLSGTSFASILNQEAVPGINDVDKLWYQPSTAARGLYSYIGGAWIIPHPSPAAGNERRHWVGTLVELRSFDGGDGTATVPMGNVGAMWVEDTEFVGRSGIGPGSVPSSSPALSVAVATNAGAGTVLQTEQMVAAHTHKVTFSNQPGAVYTHWSYDSGSPDGGIEEPIGTGGPGVNAEGMTAQLNTYTTTQVETPILHPVRGMYVIKRSDRVNYVGS